MDIVIRELVGLEEIAAIYPLYEQTGSMPEGLFRERLAAMIAQGNYRCVAAFIGERMVGMSGFWIGYSYGQESGRRPTMWLSMPRCAVLASVPN